MSDWQWRDTNTGAECRVRLMPDKIVWYWSRSQPAYVATEHEQTLDEFRAQGPAGVPAAWQPVPPHVVTELASALQAQSRQEAASAATQYEMPALGATSQGAQHAPAAQQSGNTQPPAAPPMGSAPPTQPAAGPPPAGAQATSTEPQEPVAAAVGAAFDEQIAVMYRAGQQLEAIQLYRQRYRKSEMLAKEDIEALLYKYK